MADAHRSTFPGLAGGEGDPLAGERENEKPVLNLSPTFFSRGQGQHTPFAAYREQAKFQPSKW